MKSEVIIDLRDGGDWSLDLCYAGLMSNGIHLLDIPFKVKHREWQDVIDGKKQPDWGLERRTLGFVKKISSLEELSLMASAMELPSRVWLDERMESFQKYRALGLDKIDAKVVVVAGHDRFWNHSPQFVASLYGDKLQGMLLDNWYPEYVNLPFKVRRIGWSTNFDHYWTRPEVPPEKDIDISFVGYNSHQDRARFIDHIQSKWGHLNNHIVLEREPDSFGKFVPKAEYFNIIQRSKICLNLRGAADRGKTMRAYEIPYVGSFMLSQRIDDPGMMEDFQSHVDCEYFSNEQELDDAISWNLGLLEGLEETGPYMREEIAKHGHATAIGSLSVKQRWGDVLKWLQDVS